MRQVRLTSTFFTWTFGLLVQLLDSHTALSRPLAAGMVGSFIPKMRELLDLLGFLLSRTTLAHMTEVHNKSLPQRSDTEVWKSDITVKDIRFVDRL